MLIILISFLAILTKNSHTSQEEVETSFLVIGGHIHSHLEQESFDLILHKAKELNPDLIFFTGDVIDPNSEESEKNIETLKNKMSPLNIPYYTVPQIEEDEDIKFVEKNDNLFILLETDSVHEGRYIISDEQKSALKAALNENQKSKNTFLFVRNPFWANERPHQIFYKNKEIEKNNWKGGIEPILSKNISMIWAGGAYGYTKETANKIERITNGLPSSNDENPGRLVISHITIEASGQYEERPIKIDYNNSKITKEDALMMHNNIPIYEIYIDKKDLDEMSQGLPKTPAGSSPEFWTIPLKKENKISKKAIFQHNEKEYNVEIRFRGDFATHWKDPKKSFKISFPENNKFYGTETLKLLIPSDRGIVLDSLHTYRAKKLGLIPPETQFVLLFINDQFNGVYYQIENWDKKYLETKKRTGDANLLGSSNPNLDLRWFNHLFKGIHGWEKTLEDPRIDKNNYSQLYTLIDLLTNGTEAEIEKYIFKLLDRETFIKWHALSRLSNDSHQNTHENLRLFFNNTLGKFELIPWDLILNKYDNSPGEINISSPFIDKLFVLHTVRHDSNKLLWGYINSDHLEDDLRHYNSEYEKLQPYFEEDKIIVLSTHGINTEIKAMEEIIKNNFNHFQKRLSGSNIKYTIESTTLTITIEEESDHSIIELPCLGQNDTTITFVDAKNNQKKIIRTKEDLPILWSHYGIMYPEASFPYTPVFYSQATEYVFEYELPISTCQQKNITVKNNITGQIKTLQQQ